MTDHDNDKRLDDLLNSMLADYSAAEPRPGLENRLLAGLRDAESKEASRGWSWRWLWAGAAAAAAVLLLIVWTGKSHPGGAPGNTVVRKQWPAPATRPQPQAREVPPATAGNVARHRARRQDTQPLENAGLAISRRPPVFPTPTPLSEQERLMLGYLARTPREELVAQSHADEPPVIEEDESPIALPDLVLVPRKSSNTR